MKKIEMAVLAGFTMMAASAVFAEGTDTVAADAKARAEWREQMAHLKAPEADSCYHAAFPSTTWEKVDCTRAPDRMYMPHTLSRKSGGTTGNGNDYAVEVPSLMSSAVGSFPTVTGVTSEKDGRKANVYSLQLNSNFMSSSTACNGTRGCMAWEQFVYSSSEKSAFMQYWLINYGTTCPSGWNTYSGSCWKNSTAVTVPQIAITSLGSLAVSATAVDGGNDTMVLTTASDAYSTSGKDTVTYLAQGWEESEFNIVGDGGGSEASFNTGSSVTVKVTETDGSSTAPTCASGAGTTGETNNLTLKTCSAVGGSSPYIQFTESN